MSVSEPLLSCLIIVDDKTGNHPLYGSFGNSFLQEEIQVKFSILIITQSVQTKILCTLGYAADFSFVGANVLFYSFWVFIL